MNQTPQKTSPSINASESQVIASVDLVGNAGGALEQIVSGVGLTGNLVGTITQAARQQATALRAKNTAVSSMDQNPQHNAATIKETTAASTS